MARVGLDTRQIIETAAQIANAEGIDNLSLKRLAAELGVRTPSLYNHIQSLDDLRRQLMLYGWRQMEEKLLHAVVGYSGHEAIRVMCNAFYAYATENPGVFNAMLWYNKFQDEQTQQATNRLFAILFQIMRPLNLTDEQINHLIRTFRAMLEGYALLVNNNAFGNPISIRESFDLSVEVLLRGVQALEVDV